MVETAEFNVTEPDAGMGESVQICFTTYLNETLGRSALFLLVESNSSTITFDEDITTDAESDLLMVPAGTSGDFRTCLNLTVVGDDMEEMDEVLVLDVAALSPQDSVVFPEGFDTLTVNVFNNDRKEYSPSHPPDLSPVPLNFSPL